MPGLDLSAYLATIAALKGIVMRRFATLALTGFIGTWLTGCAPNTSEPIAETAFTPPDYASAPLDLSTPKATAYSMMIAMYRGDSQMVDQVFAPDGVLMRLTKDGEIKRNGLPRWREWVGTLKTGQAHEELFAVETEQYGKLATAWAPFIIHLDGKLVGCGVNQFTMAKLGDDWRIVSGMDTQAPKEACATFRESYKNGS